MQRSTNPALAVNSSRHRDVRSKAADTSPITPAVTGLYFPSPTETRPDRDMQKPMLMPQSSSSTGAGQSSDGSIEPITPTDCQSLDQLWSTLRQKKERKMAKETPKVESFADLNRNVDAPLVVAAPRPRSPLKKKRSIATFRESADGCTVTATFQIPAIKKQDIHVSYQRNRVSVSWETVEVTGTDESGFIERIERYLRTIPLPEGTKFQDVRAAMNGKYLILKYPNVRDGLTESY